MAGGGTASDRFTLPSTAIRRFLSLVPYCMRLRPYRRKSPVSSHGRRCLVGDRCLLFMLPRLVTRQAPLQVPLCIGPFSGQHAVHHSIANSSVPARVMVA